jgi:hypothetical protein
MMREGGAERSSDHGGGVVAAVVEVVAQNDSGRNCAVGGSGTRCYDPRG